MEFLLARLVVGSQTSWRLDAQGEPQGLTVTRVLRDGGYLVCYPNGSMRWIRDDAESAARVLSKPSVPK